MRLTLGCLEHPIATTEKFAGGPAMTGVNARWSWRDRGLLLARRDSGDRLRLEGSSSVDRLRIRRRVVCGSWRGGSAGTWTKRHVFDWGNVKYTMGDCEDARGLALI